jgi:hypothetical protein
MLYDIIPEWESAYCSHISLDPISVLWSIEWTIYHDRFMRLWVNKDSNYLIGMKIGSIGFIVTPVAAWSGLLHNNKI